MGLPGKDAEVLKIHKRPPTPVKNDAVTLGARSSSTVLEIRALRNHSGIRSEGPSSSSMERACTVTFWCVCAYIFLS